MKVKIIIVVTNNEGLAYESFEVVKEEIIKLLNIEFSNYAFEVHSIEVEQVS